MFRKIVFTTYIIISVLAITLSLVPLGIVRIEFLDFLNDITNFSYIVTLGIVMQVLTGFLLYDSTKNDQQVALGTEKFEIQAATRQEEASADADGSEADDAKTKEEIDQIRAEFALASTKEITRDTLEALLWRISDHSKLVQAVLFVRDPDPLYFSFVAAYSYYGDKKSIEKIELGFGISGQAAKSRESKFLTHLPAQYLRVVSGLGEASPDFLFVLPVISKDDCLAIVEFAGFGTPNQRERNKMEKLASTLLAEAVGLYLHSKKSSVSDKTKKSDVSA